MTSHDKKTGMIEVRISPDTKERLQEKAPREGRSMSDVLRGLIHAYLEAGYAGAGALRPHARLARRYPARIAGLLAGLAAMIFLPFSLASATPVTLQVKGEIGTKTAEAMTRRKFETTVRAEPGQRFVLVPTPGQDQDFRVTVEVRPVEGGKHELAFEIEDLGDGASGEILQPKLIAEDGRPATVQIDRGAGLYVSMEAAIETGGE